MFEILPKLNHFLCSLGLIQTRGLWPGRLTPPVHLDSIIYEISNSFIGSKSGF